MKAVAVKEFHQNLSQVHISAVPQPVPRPDEILIKVIAAGVNFVDTLYARGKHQNNKSLVTPPFTLGLEFSGIIISAPDTCPFKAGDGVFGGALGSYAEYITLPASSSHHDIQRIPASWSYIDTAGLAATLPVSYAALTGNGGLIPGQTVLVHSAAGGLGSMAVQVAVAMGCRVLGTAGSPEKCASAKAFGASDCFNYTEDTEGSNWWQKVLKATDSRGVDVVFDPVGLVDLSLKCTTQRGRIIIVGFAGREGNMEKIAMNRVLLRQVTLVGYVSFHLAPNSLTPTRLEWKIGLMDKQRYGESIRRWPEEKARIWGELMPLMETGKIRPNVMKCYEGLESVPAALADMANRKISGKAVVRVAQERTLDIARSNL